MQVEILVSEESSYFSDYRSEILDWKYVSFRCYEHKSDTFPQKCGYHTQSSHSLLWCSVLHIVVSMKTTGAISLEIWSQTILMMGLNVK